MDKVNFSGLDSLKKFKESADNIRDSYLDPDYKNPEFEPATPAQIRYVYVLAKNQGMSGREAEMFLDDFHHMSKAEISDLIEDLGGGEGWTSKKQKWSRERRNLNSQRQVEESIPIPDDDDVPF